MISVVAKQELRVSVDPRKVPLCRACVPGQRTRGSAVLEGRPVSVVVFGVGARLHRLMLVIGYQNVLNWCSGMFRPSERLVLAAVSAMGEC